MTQAPVRLSVFTSTYNRAQLLDYALYTYARQVDAPPWEYIIVDDGSTDDTVNIVKKWQSEGLDLILLDAGRDLGLPKEPGAWRDGCYIKSVGSLLARGEIVIGTHPEVMIPPYVLSTMYRVVRETGHWYTAVPFFLGPDATQRPWREDLNVLVREQDPSAYQETFPHSRQASRDDWGNEVFWGMLKSNWFEMGGFRRLETWGSNDMDFFNRRRALGIKDVVVKNPFPPPQNLMVYHQFHDAPRDHERAIKDSAHDGGYLYDRETARSIGGLHAYLEGQLTTQGEKR